MKNEKSWMEREDWELLMKYVVNCCGDVVELGTYRGGTTYDIRRFLDDCYTVWSIDNYGDKEFLEKYDDYDPLEIFRSIGHQKCFIIVGDSTMLGLSWKKPVGLLFIDACHTFEATLANFFSWEHVIEGVVVFHDYDEEHVDVRKAVDLILISTDFVIADKGKSLIILRRRK